MPNKSSKDRASLCTFTFADGRRCKTPRQAGNPDFCTFHAQRELLRLAAKNAGNFVAAGVSTDYVSACALNGSLGRLFRAVACGQINPKTAHTLAYLAQVMAQTLPMAEVEFARTFGREPLHTTVTNAFGKLNPKFIKALKDPDDSDDPDDLDEPHDPEDSSEPDSPPPSVIQIDPSTPASPNADPRPTPNP
ncbi:MAG TPA: hypothetical protein VN830_03225 [Verrucomicrobiae bacterium]|nr:hypothetical protein [Verrucomicrobiae bacterium]